jgi:steroid 5-alpha reductase family enzyme
VRKQDIQSYLGVLVAVLIGAGLAWAGSQGSVSTLWGVPLFAACVIIAFAIQWVVYVPSLAARTEKYYDLTGSLTYAVVIVTALVTTAQFDTRSVVLAALVLVWAFRLGLYLARRVRKAGEDKRFREIKRSPSRFLLAWTLQGLWVSFTAAAALAAIAAGRPGELGMLGMAGVGVWAIGFAFEVIADLEKSRFTADPANRSRFITTGLWSLSRHPNYFGEIVLWVGVAMIAFPSLAGWSLLTLISPLFVAVLLTRISGVPLLEQSADERWGGQDDYEQYKQATPVLIPKLPFW